MNIEIKILGRSAVDAPYTELTSTTLVVGDAAVACTPAVPPAAAGQELALLISSDDTVLATLGAFLNPATRPGPTPIQDEAGTVVGENPAPQPFVRAQYAAFARAPRQVPFRAGDSLLLSRPGAAAA
ncbi:hypothetical protein MKK69_01695 [Methylobacterium sp. J-026]|uniref:hypothetical protein n=1 Tax=Methylobacterium sp. J-026 TaxID=2836624 RepID=UPI001FBBE534|nr:hypothetical protein [Methylobacterium sp. J-026]MCJ2132789.1 hypothetical protein [Methylobacterium sp. J-026]